MTLATLAAHCLGQAASTPDQQRQIALTLEQQGNNSEAEAAWRLYIKAHPSNPEPYAHLGLLEARQEHYKDAIPLYRKALALDSSIPGLRLNLGLAYFKAGEMKDALQEFSTLLASTPQSSPDRQRLAILVGMCHYSLGQYAQAAVYLKEAVSRDPQNLELLLTLAHSYLWSKQYQNVMDTYRAILQLNAESAEADMLAGEALDELKDPPGAIEQFRAAVKADPSVPDVHFGLGYLLWKQKDYAGAALELQAELDNNPDHAQALTYLGDANIQLGQSEKALPLLQKAAKIDPGIEIAHLDMGIIDAANGHNDDALREMKLAEKIAPKDVNVHWRLGRLYRAMGNPQQAAAELEKARTLTQAADTALVNKMNSQPKTPQSGPAGK
ncbi:MAG TPA: tetratricopeptide repeat protein [Terracidiphilus sp.]|nr:tetratricopeptide repeat protein [Terracidiphilus sp.]